MNEQTIDQELAQITAEFHQLESYGKRLDMFRIALNDPLVAASFSRQVPIFPSEDYSHGSISYRAAGGHDRTHPPYSSPAALAIISASDCSQQGKTTNEVGSDADETLGAYGEKQSQRSYAAGVLDKPADPIHAQESYTKIDAAKGLPISAEDCLASANSSDGKSPAIVIHAQAGVMAAQEPHTFQDGRFDSSAREGTVAADNQSMKGGYTR